MNSIQKRLTLLAAAPLLVLGLVHCNGAGNNHPPAGSITAPSGNVSILTGESVSFAGNGLDTDGGSVTLLWDFGDGSTSTSANPGPHTYPLAGVYTVRLTATDSAGLADPNPPTRTVTVQAAGVNRAPTGVISAPAGNPTITVGQSVTFAGTASDPDGDALTAHWDFGDGGSSALLAPGAHVYAAAGTYQVRLTVTDALGLADPNPPTRTVTVTAVPVNQAPTGVIVAPSGNLTITAGQSVTFSGSASDPNNDPVTVHWDFGDGSSSVQLVPGAHLYAVAGTYTVRMTATDGFGLADPNPPTRTITVSAVPVNGAPTGVITAPAGAATITAGQSVSFAGSATDPNGDPVTVLWDFGDGATSTALVPGAHTYATAGTYTVRLTATDSHNLADPNPPTRTITVNPAAAAPTLTQVQAAVFTPSCTGCHGSSGGLSLQAGSAWGNLVNVPAQTIPGIRVVPGSSATSALVIQLNSGHHKPSATNMTLIQGWIDAGALNN